jgi:hypothetical protein
MRVQLMGPAAWVCSIVCTGYVLYRGPSQGPGWRVTRDPFLNGGFHCYF